MNEFKIEGTVVSVEERETKNGWGFHLVTVAADGELVPVAYFGCSPATGQQVTVTGKIGSQKGFLRLIPDRGDPGRSKNWRKPPPIESRNWNKMEGPPPLPSLSKPTTFVKLDEDDDDLPF